MSGVETVKCGPDGTPRRIAEEKWGRGRNLLLITHALKMANRHGYHRIGRVRDTARGAVWHVMTKQP